MADARDLFRNEKSTEFVIVTIPTIMAMSESVRLADSLKKEGVPLHTIVVNQVCGTKKSGRREGVRLAESVKEEGVPMHTFVVNQVWGGGGKRKGGTCPH